MKNIKRILGAVIVLISIPIYRSSVGLIILEVMYTPASMLQKLRDVIFIFSNIALSLAGIQIMRDRIRALTYGALIFGLLSVNTFYGYKISHYYNTSSRLKRGEVIAPVTRYTKIIETSEKKWAYRTRGEIYYGAGEYEKALSDFKAINDYKFIILTYVKLSDIKNAINTCDVWAQAETGPRPYVWKGTLYYNQGNHEDAIEQYLLSIDVSKKVYKDHPGRRNGATVEDCIRLANCYAQSGQFSLAEQYFDQALFMANDYERAYSNNNNIIEVLVAKGNFYAFKGDMNKARMEYSLAIQKNRSLAIIKIPPEIVKKEFFITESPNAMTAVLDKDPRRQIYRDLPKMDFVQPLSKNSDSK